VVSITTLSAIEQIAQDIEDWGDGWRFSVESRRTEDGERGSPAGTKTRTISASRSISMSRVGCISSSPLRARCERHRECGTPVSVSVRNPITRKALDHINARLDEIER
jgi:hypothetical protein